MECYKYRILKYRNYNCSKNFIILMRDVYTDPIKHLPIKNETPWNEYGKNIGFRFKISYQF